MTPDDLCENIRNIVFEILKRRYPETIPTKVADNTVAIRDCEVGAIVFYHDTEGVVANQRYRMYLENLLRVTDGMVISFPSLHQVVEEAHRQCLYYDYNKIADEFGLGVER